ncbi:MULTISPECIES: ion channel [unclassified Microbacterium]|uniref:ion channel n=1 Tax=unclassified Microbacterium TaxID=2609290 RepID=UPI000EA98EC3|nr:MULTISPECIES: ion channel [unclassified Microbacterium]MBT2485504.1 two pore domain potassium channel family protein [Microbacterium sp. ISL-108]RKN68295.1 two pore domain potassium channel family protein [Microbacterium sp. CGR2]
MDEPARGDGEVVSTPPTGAEHHSSWRSGYWVVLVLLGISYVVCAVQQSTTPNAIALLFQLVTVAATLFVARVRPGLRRIGWIVIAAVGVAAVIAQVVGLTGQLVDVSLAFASLVAYFVAPFAIIAHQSRKTLVDGQTLLASIAAYVMVGMFFTFAYNLIVLWTATPLFGSAEDDSLSSLLFFSFTTLTTTGYGNLVPVGPLVQSVAIVEAITGQLFLVIAVARVVSGWRPPPREMAT